MSYVLYIFISCLVAWCRLMILLHWLASPPRLNADYLSWKTNHFQINYNKQKACKKEIKRITMKIWTDFKFVNRRSNLLVNALWAPMVTARYGSVWDEHYGWQLDTIATCTSWSHRRGHASNHYDDTRCEVKPNRLLHLDCPTSTHCVCGAPCGRERITTLIIE